MSGGSGPPAGVLAILGATATGKSAVAVAVAKALGGEVINADAFAAYRGFDAGTAKPTVAEREGVPHHLIDVKDPDEPWSAGEFARDARRIAEEVLARGRLPILCGGTGFYVRAFFHGLFEGPLRDDALRAALASVADRRGTAFLHAALRLLDPESAKTIAPVDRARLVRFLEVALLSGRPASALFRERPGERWTRPHAKALLVLSRPALHERIAARFDGRIVMDLPREVRRLLDSGVSPQAPAFSAIGYRETVDLLEGRLDLSSWRDAVLRATRGFAKRQETWFRKEPGVIRIAAEGPGVVPAVLDLSRRLYERERGDR